MSEQVVRCMDVTKSFGSVRAVKGVSFSLEQGEILSLLGPSGSGKTSLLRLIAGFERVDEGEIHIRDVMASNRRAHLPPERRKVGMVFQDYSLFPHLTVAQNVLFGLTKLPRAERRKRLAEVLDVVRLLGMDQRYPHELSGGQQQRVALARTLAPRPVTVLLDEPFSNIDANMRTDMRHEMEAILRENQITTIFVTHDREEAFALADRLGVITEGSLDQIDTPEVLYESPATPFVAQMSGVCDFLAGTVRGERVVTELGGLPWVANGAKLTSGTKVDLLVHANDFHVLAYGPGKSVVVAREFRGDEIILTVRTPRGTNLRCRQDDRYSTLPPGTHVTLAPARSTPFVVFKTAEGGG